MGYTKSYKFLGYLYNFFVSFVTFLNKFQNTITLMLIRYTSPIRPTHKFETQPNIYPLAQDSTCAQHIHNMRLKTLAQDTTGSNITCAQYELCVQDHMQCATCVVQQKVNTKAVETAGGHAWRRTYIFIYIDTYIYIYIYIYIYLIES
jgi:hypothetical protein